MQNQLQDLQENLHRDIPLTKHLKLSVSSYNTSYLVLHAPLAENSNHMGTAFAGSLISVVTLAGWSMLWFVLKELGIEGEIVIQDSVCNYQAPVTQDFHAFCYKPTSAQIHKFAQMLIKRGKARLELQAEIIESGEVRVSFTGRYVVLSKAPARQAFTLGRASA